jgi:hypothetical protein
VFLAILGMVDAGLGALLLLFGIVSAVRKGIRSAAKD